MMEATARSQAQINPSQKLSGSFEAAAELEVKKREGKG